MSLITMLIASTGLALATAGATAGPDCATNKAASSCGDKAAQTEQTTQDDHCEDTKKAYDSASWPAHNTDLYAKDFQGQTLPVALGSETWLSDKIDTEGKVIVLDFWATWCGPCRSASPILDELQKENPDSLAVMAIAGQRDPEKNVRAYIAKNNVSYANLYDEDQTAYKPFESKGIPLAVVISTDGIIRWIGNPHDENFLPAVNKIIAADLAVQSHLTAQAAANTQDG
ncbi:MAG: TlpA family protein disulfide reductase [Phycisphaerales bacterium]|nr:TlpA family protein disulfide reductase [Phycisphaerales bacterium]